MSLQAMCAIGLVTLLSACSSQPPSPTAPSAVSSGATAPAAGTAMTVPHTESLTMASAPTSSQSTANFEIKFLTDMIDHHHMAVMMAEICIPKAVHEQLRTLCQNITTAQMAVWVPEILGRAFRKF